MNDDPITLSQPLQSVPRTVVDSDSMLATFRVSLPNRGPDGQPRYKYFDPVALWTWVKDNETLPTREGDIWYEDWWALCNQYNPTHSNVPPWAYSLKTEAAYREEEAARIAKAQAEAARIAEAEAEAAALEANESRARARELDRVAREAEERAAELRRRVISMTMEPSSGDGLRPSLADDGPSNSEPRYRPITPYDEWPGGSRAPANSEPPYRPRTLSHDEGPYYRRPPASDYGDDEVGPRFRDLGAAQGEDDAGPSFRDLGVHDDDHDEPPPYRGLSANDEPAPSFMDLSAERAEQQEPVYRGLETHTRMRDGD